MRNLLFDIASYIYLIPLIMGLSKFPFLTKTQKTFFYFIILSAVGSLFAYFTSSLGNNVYVVYLFTTIEVLLIPLFLLDQLDKKRFKWIWIVGTITALGLICYDAFFRDGGIAMWNNLSLTFIALTFSTLSIRGLLKLRFDPNIYDLSKSPVFWFTLGLGIYYLGNILIFAFTRLFQEENLQVLANLAYFRLTLLYISTAMYIWGFAIIKPKPTSFSS